MKFRVHLTDGTKFETDDEPEEIQKRFKGMVQKIKRIR